MERRTLHPKKWVGLPQLWKRGAPPCARSVLKGREGGLVAEHGLGQEVGELLEGGLGVPRGCPQLGRQEAVRRLQRVEGRLATHTQNSSATVYWK